MTYSTVKPDGGPSPLLDVGQIRTNFAQFQTVFSANHTALNNTNQGDHEAVVLNQQSADPGVATNLGILYAKAIAGQPQLFSQIPKFLPTSSDPTNAPNVGVQMTYNAVNIAGPQYQSFLVGGYLIFFGSTTNIANTITLSPAPSALLVAIATPNTLNSVTGSPYSVSTTILSPSTFKIVSTLNAGGPVNPYNFQWVAIGKQ